MKRVDCPKITFTFVTILLVSCAPTPGPDKTIGGAVLGAGWGAGTGAIIGNQTNSTGPGAAVGAGVGAASGMLIGAGFDIQESSQLQTRRELNVMRARVAMNEDNLVQLRNEFNGGGRVLSVVPSGVTIFFDSNLAGIRVGSAKELERLADSLKHDPMVRRIEIYGHSDDTGSREENEKLSLARANTVREILAAHGISDDQMKIFGISTLEPKASNRTEAGRQLNRRVEILLIR